MRRTFFLSRNGKLNIFQGGKSNHMEEENVNQRGDKCKIEYPPFKFGMWDPSGEEKNKRTNKFGSAFCRKEIITAVVSLAAWCWLSWITRDLNNGKGKRRREQFHDTRGRNSCRKEPSPVTAVGGSSSKKGEYLLPFLCLFLCPRFPCCSYQGG